LAIELLAESRLHHLYLVDDHRVPIGVVSLGDVVAALVGCLHAA
jgi:CBS-domain-containing membrane protein